MSALVERIIAARDELKRGRLSDLDRLELKLDLCVVMADAANVIVGQEALLKAESAARLDLSLLAAEEAAKADLLRALLTRSREYVTDTLDAHEHTDGRDLLKEIDAALGQRGAAPADGSQVAPSTTGAGRHIPSTPPFIQWNGGENPAPGKQVQFLRRWQARAGSGDFSEALADKLDWGRDPRQTDIIAYRIIPTDDSDTGKVSG